jgi:regulator of cell morphogenesis and NO signaling
MNELKKPQAPDIHSKTIGEFVAEDYRSAAVFEKYGIDFCCGGQVPISSACREKGLDPDTLEREIEEARSAPSSF